MGFIQRIFGLTAGLAVLQTAYAGLDLTSDSTVAVYWGQNSFRGSGDLAQQRLSHYCTDPKIDVIILAFVMRINGLGGVPEVDFSTASEKCEIFEGTNLRNCPEIGEDITTCQNNGKTIILSIGGATYSEGGFPSAAEAEAGADLIWATFGPPSSTSRSQRNTRRSSSSKGRCYQRRNANAAHRPFGSAAVDGFDFDFEASVTNMAPFANRLRALADSSRAAAGNRPFYLTAAPQCPYPDAADKDILNGGVKVDAVWVQFYNNYCGANSFTAGSTEQKNFNFATWDDWAKTQSANKDVKIYLGVPANTGAASTGYLPVSQLEPIIEYSRRFQSFGGVMMWDVTQAYGNPGFLDGLESSLGRNGGAHAPVQAPPAPAVAPSSSSVHPSSWHDSILAPPTHAPVQAGGESPSETNSEELPVQTPVSEYEGQPQEQYQEYQEQEAEPQQEQEQEEEQPEDFSPFTQYLPHIIDAQDFQLDDVFS